jgi:hypothetical protein
MNLMFEAGRVAENRGLVGAQVVSADALESISPGEGDFLVVADQGSFSVPEARVVAALRASGKNLVVVTPAPLGEDIMAWMPEGCTHVVGERIGPHTPVSDLLRQEESAEDPRREESDHEHWEDRTGNEDRSQSNVPPKDFDKQVSVLCELVVATANVKEWEQYRLSCDLGLALAVARENSLATLHDSGKAYVEEAYKRLLEVLEIEGEFATLGEIFDAALAKGSAVAK